MPNRVISVYWKKQKYGDSITGKWYYFTEMEDLVEAIKSFEPKLKAPVITEEKTDLGVQACIDHVNKKAELIGKHKGADNAMATLLKTVAQELYQYL